MTTVDVERLLSPWLAAQPEIDAIVNGRVYTEIPKTPVFPLIRLTLIDDRPVFARPRYLTSTLLQIDCYGGPKVIGRQLADLTCDLLATRFLGTHDAGVISSTNSAMRYLPDVTYDPAKPRYVVDASVYSHP